jgi:integrase/recombinase XerD
MVDLQLARHTVRTYRSCLKTFFRTVKKPITQDAVRNFLCNYSQKYPNKSTYSCMLKALKCYFKRYLKSDIVDSFRFPKQPYVPKRVPTKEQLQEFYAALPTLKERALFLLYATSGLRKSEIMSMRLEDLDPDRRMIIPNVHSGNTKKSWIGFFNEEAKEVLAKYLAKCEQNPQYYRKVRVFNPSKNPTRWKEARERTGLNITPKVLRDWFCCQMGELGVPDRYIDAFCGRIPKSVLARHYTDYNPERLKRIYDKAGLKLLS